MLINLDNLYLDSQHMYQGQAIAIYHAIYLKPYGIYTGLARTVCVHRI